MTEPVSSKFSDFLQGRGLYAAIVSGVIITIATFIITLHPIRSGNDVWWHLKSGQYISENGLPEKDVFAYPAEDMEWHNHEWITQVVMWKIYQWGEGTRLGGIRAVSVLKGVVIWLTVMTLWFLAARLSGSWWIALLVAAMALGVGRRTHYPRPPVLSNLLLALLILLLTAVEEWKLNRKWLLVIPPLFALWTNLHGAWMAGLVVMAAYGFQNLLPLFTRGKDSLLIFHHPPNPIPWKWLVGIGVAVFVATLINPYGYHLYALPARVMSEKELIGTLGELLPPKWIAVLDFLTVIGLTVVCYVLGWKKAPRRIAEILLYVFFLYQAVNHIRHLLLFSIFLVPIMARLLPAAFQTLCEWAQKFVFKNSTLEKLIVSASPIFLIMSFGWLTYLNSNWPESVSYFQRFRQFTQDRTGYVESAFPKALVDYIELVDFPDGMYNGNNYAGYLIWRLAPDQQRVFSDSRFDIFGAELWKQELIVSSGIEKEEAESGEIKPYWEEAVREYGDWRGVVERQGIKWMILRPTEVIVPKLREDEDWVMVADFARIPGSGEPWLVFVDRRQVPENFIPRAQRIFDGMATR